MNSGEHVKRFRKTTTIGALAVGAVLAVAGTAAAQSFGAQAETRWCTGSDLVISATDMRSPSAATTAHRIRFVAAEGVSCRIGGSLSNVRFLNANGDDMGVQLTGGQGQYTEAPVDANREAAVYVSSPRKSALRTPAFIRFDLPGQGSLGDAVKIAWPSSIGTPVQLSNVMMPVS
jgi:hypothetical protein